jgi:hypothetical protein
MPTHAEHHETHHPKAHTTTPRQRVWVIAFVIAAAALFAGVLFLATGKSRIAFTWTPQPIEGTTTLTVAASPAGEDIPAAFVEKSVEVSKVFTAETKGATTPTPTATTTTPTFNGKARGNITISNRYSKAQPLIAGTRLKSPDGQIFRTQQRVDVPVGGSVTTEVIADVAGERGALPKGTKFTLPALWAGLQDKINGVSTEDFHGETQAATATTTTTPTGPGLTANELANAELTLQQEAITQALPDLQKLVPSGQTLFTGMVDAATVKRTGPTIGDKVATYTLTLTVKTTAIAVAATKLTESATALLTTSLSPDLQLLTVDPATFGFTLKSTDTKKHRADVTLVGRGFTVAAPSHRLLQQATYAGKTADEVRSLLSQEKAASGVVVELTPFWNTHVPSNAKDLQLEVTRAK